jgi:purine-binding chemotaxis protein CheW
MSLAQQFCTFLLDGHVFGVKVEQVREVILYQEMTRVPLLPCVVRGLINLRGQIITAVDLRRRLGMSDLPKGELPMNVVVRTEDGAISLLVDEIGDVIEVQDDTFEAPPETLQGPTREVVCGVHKLPDRLLLVLDIESAVNPGDLTAHLAEKHA